MGRYARDRLCDRRTVHCRNIFYGTAACHLADLLAMNRRHLHGAGIQRYDTPDRLRRRRADRRGGVPVKTGPVHADDDSAQRRRDSRLGEYLRQALGQVGFG